MKNFSFPLCLGVSVVLGSHGPLAAQEKPEPSKMFPFVIPWDDASKTITDVSALIPAPLDERRRIVVKDGHFYDGTGRRVRFLGNNFTFSANFPHKPGAAKVAARMRKYGFNIVRLHHMDYFKAPAGIFDPKFPDMQHLDADQLDRLDYLIYQLKQHGIYVDINLHVSRAFTAADGFADADKLPALGKVTAYFEPRMIALQKGFARDLLMHRNPYTKLRYVDDPVVALIEINNEDTLLGAAWTDAIETLPDAYKNQLIKQWNIFLMEKYGTSDNLKRAWNPDGKPLGNNVLLNSQFAQETTGWSLEPQKPTRAEMAVEDVDGDVTSGKAPRGRALHLKVQEVDEISWHLQLHQNALDFKSGTNYTVTFWARANETRSLPVYTGMDKEPWRNTGLEKTITLTPQWKRYSMSFSARQPEPNHNRLSLILGNKVGDVWLADLTLREGIAVEFEPGQTLEKGNLELPAPAGTPQGQDYVAFLIEVERQYAEGMRAYIKDTLRAKALVTCSQASYGGLGGVYRESKMDFVDMHAYWMHPHFPRKSWDAKDWTVENVSMVRDINGGTLPGLAMHRVAGKPFTVSEYNHAAPIDYGAETLPLLAAYAAWQDWDGIFLFDYNSNRDNWGANHIKGFFSVDTNPGKMALMPAAAALFLRGDLAPRLSGRHSLVVPQTQVAALTARHGNNMSGLWTGNGVSRRDMIDHPVAVRFVSGSGLLHVEKAPSAKTAAHGLNWQTNSPETALFTITAPASKAVVGFLGGRSVDLGGVLVKMEPTARNFLALTLTAKDQRAIARSSSLLLTAAGNVENTDMGWNEKRDSVSDQWGTGPTLAEGIPATITLQTTARTATVHALNSSGARVKTVPSQLKNGRLTFSIGPEHQSLWYEIATPQAPAPKVAPPPKGRPSTVRKAPR